MKYKQGSEGLINKNKTTKEYTRFLNHIFLTYFNTQIKSNRGIKYTTFDHLCVPVHF